MKCTLAEFRNTSSPIHQPEFSSVAGSQDTIPRAGSRPSTGDGPAPKRRKRQPQTADAKKASLQKRLAALAAGNDDPAEGAEDDGDDSDEPVEEEE